MVQELLLLSFVGTMIVSGKFTCPGSDMLLDGSKCYKLIDGSPEDGQESCTNEDINASLMLPPTNEAATNISKMFFGEKIWVGLRFHNGAEWIWDDGSREPTISKNVCESGWENIRNRCYKRLRHKHSGVDFSDARKLCSNENAYIMMPQSQSEAKEIANGLDSDSTCWVGITDFDADHTYTWENGTEANQSSLYFADGEPNKRNMDYVCEYIQNGKLNNGDCKATERVICVIDAIDSSPTIASFKTFTQMSGPSAYIQTTVHTPAIRTNLTNMTTLQTSLDFTKASGMSSTDTGGNTEHNVTSEHNSVGQFDNTSTMPDEYLVSAMSDSRLACIIKCTSSCADYANSTKDTSPNIPYKVNRKLLSSYRRIHTSANDSRKSSLYIGSIGSVILVLSVLSIIMLDFLPRA